MNKALDTFRINGNTYDEFKAEVNELSAITKDMTVLGEDVEFFSVCTQFHKQIPGKLCVYLLTSQSIDAFINDGAEIPTVYIPDSLIGEELRKELCETTNLLVGIDNKMYIVSDLALQTLTQRASVSGDKTMNRQNFIRNLHFADCIFSKNEKIHVVYREYVSEEGIEIRKIFAMLGSQYNAISQNIVIGVCEQMMAEKVLGSVEMDYWYIDHRFTDAILKMPDAAEDFKATYGLPDEIVPGVFICTSDVGASGIICRGIYRKGSAYVISDEVSIKHVGRITKEDVLEVISQQILPNLRKLPEMLAELITKEVVDYSTLDLTQESDVKKAKEALEKLYKKVLKTAFKGILPRKRQNELLEALTMEINGSIHYTKYDVAMTFMGLPERLEGLDRATLTNLRKACHNVPFILNDSKKKEVVEEQSLVLLPE